MSNIAIAYSTTDGHTQRICLKLRQIIENNKNQVKLIPIECSAPVDLRTFDKIVIGASIRYGRHSSKTYTFIKQNLAVISSKPNAFFSVNVIARKPEKSTPATNPYLNRFLRSIAWRPDKLAVFAGKLDYQKYDFWNQSMIRAIMWLTKGPTDLTTNIEYTNWNQVEEFGRTICTM